MEGQRGESVSKKSLAVCTSDFRFQGTFSPLPHWAPWPATFHCRKHLLGRPARLGLLEDVGQYHPQIL